MVSFRSDVSGHDCCEMMRDDLSCGRRSEEVTEVRYERTWPWGEANAMCVVRFLSRYYRP